MSDPDGYGVNMSWAAFFLLLAIWAAPCVLEGRYWGFKQACHQVGRVVAEGKCVEVKP